MDGGTGALSEKQKGTETGFVVKPRISSQFNSRYQVKLIPRKGGNMIVSSLKRVWPLLKIVHGSFILNT